jgi:sortase A
MGRQASYGGPFGKLDHLRAGDRISVLTGQGQSTYIVSGLRLAGDPIPPALTGTQGRLTLVTAGGTPYLPDHVLRVDAALASKPMVTPARVFSANGLQPSELTMRGDRTNVFALVLWSQALLLASVAFVWARTHWGRRQAWAVGVPVLLALGVTVSDLAAQLLPNLM